MGLITTFYFDEVKTSLGMERKADQYGKGETAAEMVLVPQDNYAQ